MQNIDQQIKLSNILPEIKNQTFTASFSQKQAAPPSGDIKPGTSYLPQRQALKNINYSSQTKQVKLDEVSVALNNFKNAQKISLNNIKDQSFQDEITDLMQIQVAQEQRAARNIEKHFKKTNPNAQLKSRNLSENMGVGRGGNLGNSNNILLQNSSYNQNLDEDTEEIGLFVPTNIEKLKSQIKQDTTYINKRDISQKKMKEQKSSSSNTYSKIPTPISTNKYLQSDLQPQLLQQSQPQQQQQVQIKNKDFILKKQKIRGPQGLNIKVVEMWINDTICEAESEISIPNQQKNPSDKQNSPQKKQSGSDSKDILKSFGLDRKSLLNKGISKENIDRIYRSLFVYSFGFYEMIQDIFAHIPESAKIVANVWKIYGILLEYCSRTDFVNTVTQLEKEKTAIVDNLEEQIEQKQKQFDELENIEKEKREILEQQILSLKQEKLEEDFKQADSAYNEEVGLRLQFEHKINELHSIHRELLMKHNRLIDDYDSMKVEHELLKNDYENNNRLINTLKVLESKSKDECRELQRKVNETSAQFEKLKERAVQAESELQHKNRGADKYEGLLNEEQRINEDLRFQLKNMQEKIDLQIRNEEIYKRRIDELKGEQKYYNQKMDDQSDRFEKLQQKIYDLEKEIIDLKSTALLQAESYAQIKAHCESFENKILEIQGEKKKVEQEYEYCMNRNELLTTDLEALQKLIKDMKIGRIELEEEYIKCKLRLNNSLDTIKAKNELCKDLEIKMEVYEQNHLKLTVEFQTYQNMATKEQDSLKQKISKLDRELKSKIHEMETEKKQNDFGNQKLEQCNSQLEGLRKQILDLTSASREDKFLLNNQSNNINQLTNVIEAEKSRITDLIKQVTSLTTINENLSRETKSQKVIIRELQDNHSTTIDQLKQQQKKELEKFTNVEFKIHLMVYEDLQSRYYQLAEDKVRIDQCNDQLEKQMNERLLELQHVKAQYEETNLKLLNTQKMFSHLRKYSLNFFTNYLNSDRKADSLEKQLKEAKNEAQYKKEKEILIKLNEKEETKLKAQIKSYEQELKETQELVGQKLEQIRQLQESFKLIEQLKQQQSQQQQQLLQPPSFNEAARNSMTMLNKTGQINLSQQQLQQTQQQIKAIQFSAQTQDQRLQNNLNNNNNNNNNNTKGVINSAKPEITEEGISYQQIQTQKQNGEFIKQEQKLPFQQGQQSIIERNGNQPNLMNLQQDQIKVTDVSSDPKYGMTTNKDNTIVHKNNTGGTLSQTNPQSKANPIDSLNEQLQLKQQQQQQQLKQNYMGGAAADNETSSKYKQSYMNAKQNNSFSYSMEDQYQRGFNGNILTQDFSDNKNERLVSEGMIEGANGQGQFLPYHLSALGRMNNSSTTYNNKIYTENTPQNHNIMTNNSQIRKPSQSFYSGGAYRLTQDHSKYVQNQVVKKLKQQTKDNKEFSKLFKIASDHYNYNSTQN